MGIEVPETGQPSFIAYSIDGEKLTFSPLQLGNQVSDKYY
jgi:hypothetical protein